MSTIIKEEGYGYSIEWTSEPQEGFQSFEYNCKSLIRNQTSTRTVYCRNHSDFLTFLKIYNKNPNWEYTQTEKKIKFK